MQEQSQESFLSMATETNIATYDENGVPVVRPMIQEELAQFLEMQALATEISTPDDNL
jgi:hypothetical protein